MTRRSDTACIHLICMTYKDWERKSWRREDEEGEERERIEMEETEGDIRYVKKCLQKAGMCQVDWQ